MRHRWHSTRGARSPRGTTCHRSRTFPKKYQGRLALGSEPASGLSDTPLLDTIGRELSDSFPIGLSNGQILGQVA